MSWRRTFYLGLLGHERSAWEWYRQFQWFDKNGRRSLEEFLWRMMQYRGPFRLYQWWNDRLRSRDERAKWRRRTMWRSRNAA